VHAGRLKKKTTKKEQNVDEAIVEHKLMEGTDVRCSCVVHGAAGNRGVAGDASKQPHSPAAAVAEEHGEHDPQVQKSTSGHARANEYYESNRLRLIE
jgi:hypothetical protein